MSEAPTEAPNATAAYCRLCGGPAAEEAYDGGTRPSSYAHLRCSERLHLEPPRFCGECGRRLKVQVTPLGWRAACSRHGATTSAPAAR